MNLSSRQKIIYTVNKSNELKKESHKLLKESLDILKIDAITECEWAIKLDTTWGTTVGFSAQNAPTLASKKIFATVEFKSNCCRLGYCDGPVTKVDVFIIKKAFESFGVDWFPFEYLALGDDEQ